MGFRLWSVGNWAKTVNFFNKTKNLSETAAKVLDECARKGCLALEEATPTDSGETAKSWDYEIESSNGATTVTWINTNLANGEFPVAIMLQYGHGTGTGGYVQGVDYINPAIKPVFDEIAETIWKVVTSS